MNYERIYDGSTALDLYWHGCRYVHQEGERMRIERIQDHAINLDDFDRSQEVKRVYVNDSGRLLLQDQIWTMDWSLEHKREVAADLKSDNYIAYAVWEKGQLLHRIL